MQRRYNTSAIGIVSHDPLPATFCVKCDENCNIISEVLPVPIFVADYSYFIHIHMLLLWRKRKQSCGSVSGRIRNFRPFGSGSGNNNFGTG
jgi:hypothetical protein